MKRITFLIFIICLTSCLAKMGNKEILVHTPEDLESAIKNAHPGDEIVMSNKIWKDIRIKFYGKGTPEKPIIIKAETPGKVFIEGQSDLKLGGEYLIVKDLYFRNGHTPSNAVITFKLNDTTLANNCRVTNCVIKDYNQPNRAASDHWVEFWGRKNQIDHCYLAGKTNEGPTLLVEIKGNQSIRNYHKIIYNYFGPRPRKGGPKAETMRLGDSFTSMSPGNTLVANNFFDRCNGEVEVISSKTNYNEFRNNVFFHCEGSLVTRHGNYCIIDGNFFIGDGNSPYMGGIRLINTGHKVTNNYFINLKGKDFRSPLAIMNGIPKSPLNRYNQVTDAVISFNTWINCQSPWQFGVGNNIDQQDVLPPSEIRSARPIRTEVTNNIIFNETGDPAPIIEFDKTDGILFRSNLINNQGVTFNQAKKFSLSQLPFTALDEFIMVPDSSPDIKPYQGFEYDKISHDILGHTRSKDSWIGAISQPIKNSSKVSRIFDKNNYGPDWFAKNEKKKVPSVWPVKEGTEALRNAILRASDGDTIELLAQEYTIKNPLIVDKAITIRHRGNSPAAITYSGPQNTPLFELHPYGFLSADNLLLKGSNSQIAFAPLKDNMSAHYNLKIENCLISNFQFVIKGYKNSFADEIQLYKTQIEDCENGIELSAQKEAKGDYNAEYLIIDNCSFTNIKRNIVDYYRGGYDESTIGGNLELTNSKFQNCGQKEETNILINTHGIINVNITNNTFKNNDTKLVAVLWGAKNNHHSNNQLINSGKIIVEENLQLKLVY